MPYLAAYIISVNLTRCSCAGSVVRLHHTGSTTFRCMMRMNTLNPLTFFRSPSGMSNELTFDANEDLIACEGADFGGRRVTKADMKTGKSVIIAGLYQGKPFNSPNDLTIDEKGSILLILAIMVRNQ